MEKTSSAAISQEMIIVPILSFVSSLVKGHSAELNAQTSMYVYSLFKDSGSKNHACSKHFGSRVLTGGVYGQFGMMYSELWEDIGC